MFSVIFEVLPAERKKDEYLALAKHLKPILESIDGFVDDERYESQRRPVARLAAHLGLDANGGAVVDHDVWTSILNPRQDGAAGVLARPAGGRCVDAEADRRRRALATPQDPRGARLWPLRSPRSEQYYPDVKNRETKHPAPARKTDAAAS